MKLTAWVNDTDYSGAVLPGSLEISKDHQRSSIHG